MEAFDESYRFGRLGFSMLHKFNAAPWLARLSNIYYCIVHGWARPLSECRLPLLEACQSGLQSGDTEFGILCATENFFMRFDTHQLPDLEHEIDLLTERMMLYELKTIVTITKPFRKLIQVLICDANKSIIDITDKYRSYCVKVVKSNQLLYAWTFVHLSFLHFLFGDYFGALGYAKECASLAGPFYGPTHGSFVALVCGLADVSHARQTKRRRANTAKKFSKLLLRWATLGESRNFIGKHYLLEAELAALSGDKARSYNFYIIAIAACREGRFMLQTAIATERVARSLFEWGQPDRRIPFFQDAVSLYQEWGASCKVRHLKSERIQLGIFLRTSNKVLSDMKNENRSISGMNLINPLTNQKEERMICAK
jgi:hypothetical protein